MVKVREVELPVFFFSTVRFTFEFLGEKKSRNLSAGPHPLLQFPTGFLVKITTDFLISSSHRDLSIFIPPYLSGTCGLADNAPLGRLPLSHTFLNFVLLLSQIPLLVFLRFCLGAFHFLLLLSCIYGSNHHLCMNGYCIWLWCHKFLYVCLL